MKTPKAYAAPLIAQAAAIINVDVKTLRKSHSPQPTIMRYLIFRHMKAVGYTSSQIGAAFDRHHPAVFYGLKKIDELLSVGDVLAVQFKEEMRF